MARNRFRLGCILVPIGLLVVPIAGTWVFMKVLASALHPDPQAIPSVTRTEPRSVTKIVSSTFVPGR